ncbi:hypothetical protein AU074_18245 [Pseudomonas sp. ATCC PTA-122608]|uniref:KAP family P-loop NTPase fold protein n=1 Tax=Pseudomonas sp. ATCC PTA-122608 TaxID=1771311 RepID=UPI00096BA86B|nr:P-loop NTPase fold protein [Pseudomonas sp. ATCC PTA-122608]OLY76434.1 hypothetical protein AU074_18245 [Pseudomonas sp. ATCC PTA-122608]
MRLKNKNLEIPHDNIFLNDKLQRINSVKNLTLLLRNVSSPLVFSVNAPWGAGKTTYLKMLHASLIAENSKSIYFSAWETDFAVDPLLAFLGEMNSSLSRFLVGDSKKLKAWRKVKAAGVHIMRRSIPVGVKLATAGLIDADKLVEDEVGKVTESLSKDVIDAYSKNKEAISEFKKNVSEVLRAADGGVEKLYIFVDELDRCRPTYAIELLERVKHLLDIEGLVFVLALDKVQLAHSVKAVYGADFDALGYLRRFIDIEFSLPSTGTEFFINHLFDHFELDEYFGGRTAGETVYDRESLLNSLKVVCSGMSLRSIEQLFSKIKLISLTVANNQYFFPEFMVFLLSVKDNYPKIYSEFSRQEADGKELLSLIDKVFPGGDDQSVWTRQYLEAVIVSGKMRGARSWSENHVMLLKGIVNSNMVAPEKLEHSRRVLELIQNMNRMGGSVPLVELLSRIEMLSNFNFD